MSEVKYTEEMVERMVEQYTANPTRETVNAIADELGKPARSIIAKLTREGVYVAQPRTSKTGAPVIRKEQLVAYINQKLGIEAPSLAKATKADLARLVSAIGIEEEASA